MDGQRVDENHSASAHGANAVESFADPCAPSLLSGLETTNHTPQLTTRELLALQVVARGYTSEQITLMLDTTAGAVDRTLEQATNRLGAIHQTHAVAIAIRQGLIA